MSGESGNWEKKAIQYLNKLKYKNFLYFMRKNINLQIKIL